MVGYKIYDEELQEDNPYHVIHDKSPKFFSNRTTVVLWTHRILCFIWALSSYVAFFAFGSPKVSLVFAAVALSISFGDVFVNYVYTLKYGEIYGESDDSN